MMDKKHGCCQHDHGMKMDCCEEHMMSKEHLKMKKEMLEKKLEWVNEQLKKSK